MGIASQIIMARYRNNNGVTSGNGNPNNNNTHGWRATSNASDSNYTENNGDSIEERKTENFLAVASIDVERHYGGNQHPEENVSFIVDSGTTDHLITSKDLLLRKTNAQVEVKNIDETLEANSMKLKYLHWRSAENYAKCFMLKGFMS